MKNCIHNKHIQSYIERKKGGNKPVNGHKKTVDADRSFFSSSFDTPRGESLPGGVFFVPVRSRIIRDSGNAACRALAVHCIVRANEHRTGRRAESYTLAEIHGLTGMHYETIKKALPLLAGNGLCETLPDGRIRFLRARSGNKDRNVKIEVRLGDGCVHKTYRAILKERLLNKFRQMRYFSDAQRRLDEILDSEHKGTCKEVKGLRKATVDHREQRRSDGSTQPYGITYAKMSAYLGVGVSYCQLLVKELTADGIITKHGRRERLKFSHEAQLDYMEYTFVFRGYVYIVYANEYGLVER